MALITTEKNTLYEKLILHIIREKGVVSRAVIHRMTGIRFSTITSITKELLSKGIICEASENKSDTSVNVSKKALSINKDYASVVGVDVQVSQITAVLADMCGNILSDIVIPLSEASPRHEIEKAILRATDNMLQKADKKVLGIGVSTIGLLDRTTQDILLVFDNPNWTGLNFISLLREHYPQYHIHAEDQAICKLGAEKWFSAQPICSNAVYVDIGDIFGASILYNGVPLRNKIGTLGEIGHFPVSTGNELCTCGNQGCLSTVASAGVIVRQVRQALEQGTISILNSMTGGDLNNLTIQMILEAAEKEDRIAIRFLSGAAHYIGKAISYVVNLMGTEEVILGGSMITDSNFFTNAIVSEIKSYSLYLLAKNLRFRKALVRPFGGVLGAVYIVLGDFFDSEFTSFTSLYED